MPPTASEEQIATAISKITSHEISLLRERSLKPIPIEGTLTAPNTIKIPNERVGKVISAVVSEPTYELINKFKLWYVVVLMVTNIVEKPLLTILLTDKALTQELIIESPSCRRSVSICTDREPLVRRRVLNLFD